MSSRIKMVVFDWAGTVIDHGCFAPVAAFTKLFAARGVAATLRQAREPMGLEKREHIRAMLAGAELARAWHAAHGRAWTEADVDALYNDFVPIQLKAIDEHSDLVPGALEALELLRQRGIKSAGTTGYFEAAARRVQELAASQGFALDSNSWAVPGQKGRPAPWMIFRNMERLGVYPASAVLKIGDTVHDVAEGLNAGSWSVVVLRAASAIGLSRSEYDALTADDRGELISGAAQSFYAAGAHAVIESLSELPALLDRIEKSLNPLPHRSILGAPPMPLPPQLGAGESEES